MISHPLILFLYAHETSHVLYCTVWTCLDFFFFVLFWASFLLENGQKVWSFLIIVHALFWVGQPDSHHSWRCVWSFCGHFCCFGIEVPVVPSNGTTIARRLGWWKEVVYFFFFLFRLHFLRWYFQCAIWHVLLQYDTFWHARCWTIEQERKNKGELLPKQNNRDRSTPHKTLTQRLGTSNSNEQCAHRLSAGCAMACANDIWPICSVPTTISNFS